jgi:hypothetical protein
VIVSERRALRGWAVDRLHDGLSPPYSEPEVWKALGATALAAVNARWTQAEWVDLVTQPGRDGLWRQYAIRRDKPKPKARLRKVLDDLWDGAVQHAVENPSFGEHVKDEIADRVIAIREAVQDPEADLTDADRAVLSFAADRAEQVGSTVVNLPWRDVQEGTGLGERTTKNALRRLDRREVLPLRERGRPGTRRPRANAFEIPDSDRLFSYLCRGTRQVGPLARTGGTPTEIGRGTPTRTGGTPTAPTERQNPMEITIKVTEDEQAEILALLAEHRRQRPTHEVVDDLPENVRPIRCAE